jgi:hypothetical protein
MKFKHLLVLLALFAGAAQANTISTTVRVDNAPIDQPVAYVNFNVFNAGLFDISAKSSIFDGLDPVIFLFTNPVSNVNFIESDNNGGFGNNSLISRNLGFGSYVLAVSTNVFTLEEAIGGYNNSVNFRSDGDAKITISSQEGYAEFGDPSAIPVPAAAWLFGSALVGLMGLHRRKL